MSPQLTNFIVTQTISQATCIACLGESAPAAVNELNSSVGESMFAPHNVFGSVSGIYPLTVLILGSYVIERVIPA